MSTWWISTAQIRETKRRDAVQALLAEVTLRVKEETQRRIDVECPRPSQLEALVRSDFVASTSSWNVGLISRSPRRYLCDDPRGAVVEAVESGLIPPLLKTLVTYDWREMRSEIIDATFDGLGLSQGGVERCVRRLAAGVGAQEVSAGLVRAFGRGRLGASHTELLAAVTDHLITIDRLTPAQADAILGRTSSWRRRGLAATMAAATFAPLAAGAAAADDTPPAVSISAVATPVASDPSAVPEAPVLEVSAVTPESVREEPAAPAAPELVAVEAPAPEPAPQAVAAPEESPAPVGDQAARQEPPSPPAEPSPSTSPEPAPESSPAVQAASGSGPGVTPDGGGHVEVSVPSTPTAPEPVPAPAPVATVDPAVLVTAARAAVSAPVADLPDAEVAVAVISRQLAEVVEVAAPAPVGLEVVGVPAGTGWPTKVAGRTGAALPASARAEIIQGLKRPERDRAFLAEVVDAAAKLQTEGTKVNVRVLVGQAALESGYGRSELASKYHNLFGVKAGKGWTGPTVDLATHEVFGGRTVGQVARWRVYSSVEEAVADYAEMLSEADHYADALPFRENDAAYLRGMLAKVDGSGKVLIAQGRPGAMSYATDPHYAAKVQKIIKSNKIDKMLPSAKAVAARHARAAAGVVDRSTLRGAQATAATPRAPGQDAVQAAGGRNGRLAPTQLATVGQGSIRLQPAAAAAFKEMSAAYEKEFGEPLSLREGYRSFKGQVAAKKRHGDFAATPGHSVHGWGLAIDIKGLKSFTSDEYRWLSAHAVDHGFIHPYFARKGGPTPEPWHWEYQGAIVK